MSKRRIVGMIAAGLGLALLLFAGLTLADRLIRTDGETVSTPAETIPQEASLTPVRFLDVSETDESGQSTLRIRGEAEPGSVVVLLDRGERIRQVRTNDSGLWSVALDIPPQPMAIEAVMFERNNVADSEDGEADNRSSSISIRGVQTIFRIERPQPQPPQPAEVEPLGESVAEAEDDMDLFDEDAEQPPRLQALIMISAPGAPTRLVQSPFGALPGSGEFSEGPLFIGPVDYDDTGGVIFSGLSDEPGRVRLHVANSAIGDTRIGADGRWTYIASSVMPLGEYPVRAELLDDTGVSEETPSVTVLFERLPPIADADSDDGALSVNFEPFHWQIRRSLVGGGVQSTVIFAPEM